MGEKARKHILSAEIIKKADQILAARALERQRQLDDRERNKTLLAPDGDIDTTSPEAQRGRSISRSSFVHRVRKLNPNLWYEQSVRYPQQGGIYIQDPSSPYGKRMVCGMPHEHLNEFSLRITVPEVIPAIGTQAQWETIQRVDQQEPGWRAILLTLLKEGLLSPSGIDREFNIIGGRSSQKWQQAIN